MDELSISRLESLSTGELIRLAGEHDLDIPGDLDRIFIIEELLYPDHEVQDTNGDVNHHNIDHDEFEELAVLPHHYNISFLEVIIRDPLWAFVFWEIKAHDRNIYEHEDDFDDYCLRVIPLDEHSLQPKMAAAFIVTVDPEEGGRYLGFPPEDGPYFKVELCTRGGEKYTVITESRVFRLPYAPHTTTLLLESYNSPLARLSGIEQFSLIHSEDRLLRSRGIGSAGEKSRA